MRSQLQKALKSSDAIFNLLIDSLQNYELYIVLTFIILLVILILSSYYLKHKTVSEIVSENERTTIMLMMLPREVLSMVPEIRGYVQRHSDKKDHDPSLESNQLEKDYAIFIEI